MKVYGWIRPRTLPTLHNDWIDPYTLLLESLVEIGKIKEYSREGTLLIIVDNDHNILKFNSTMTDSLERMLRSLCRPSHTTGVDDRLEEITDMLVKTYRDKKIRAFHFLPSEEVVWDSQGVSSEKFKLTDYDGIFNALEALYGEEFEIETGDDIKRVVKGAEIALSNGVTCTFINRYQCSQRGYYLNVHNSQTNRKDQLAFTALKGAKVKQ